MPLKQRQALIRICLVELRERGWSLDEKVFMARLSLRQTEVPDRYEMLVRKAAARYTVEVATKLGLAA